MFQFSRVSRIVALLMLMLVAVAGTAPAQTPGRSQRQPARDTSAQGKAAQALPAGLISGRVVTADTGRPVKRARVLVTAAELPQGRATLDRRQRRV